MKKVLEEEIFDAYRKLQSYIYFDNADLRLRNKFAAFKQKNDGKIKSYLRKLADKINTGTFKIKNNDVNIYFAPKKICGNEKIKTSSNFYSNANIYDGTLISAVTIFCDLSIDLHIVDVLWIIRYGQRIDYQLSKNSFGNRLSLHDDRLSHGRVLFKPYQGQFQKWWGQAIESTQDLINNEDNATIINFDLKDFYHRLRVNFADCYRRNFSQELSVDDDPLSKVFIEFHQKYKTKVCRLNHEAFRLIKDDECPLPIGVLSSPIIANWYLKSLDNYIEQELKPVYYGRYVDDVMLVFKNTILEDKHFNDPKNEGLSKDGNLLYLNTHLNNLFRNISIKGEDIHFVSQVGGDINCYENLILQEAKLFIYQFDSEFSPNLIGKFVQDQKERSSEFRFLSDSSDESFGKFENNIFESSFDNIDGNKANFKNVEDNKFKLSVFLSKLISRRIQNGEGYKEEEIEKVSKYFKGYASLKYYFFWEKILSLFVIANRKDLVLRLVKEVLDELEQVDTDIDFIAKGDILENIKQFLLNHLKESISMSIGLNLLMFFEDVADVKKKSLRLNKRSEKQYFYKIFENDGDSDDFELYNRIALYRRQSFLRKFYSSQPLIQLLEEVRNSDFSLTRIDIWNVINIDKKSEFYSKKSELSLRVPYRVKFYEAVLFRTNLILKIETATPSAIHKQWWNDILNSGEILDQSFELFWRINNDGLPYFNDTHKEKVKKEYYQLRADVDEGFMPTTGCDATRHPTLINRNYFINQIRVNKNRYEKENLRVAIVNTYVNFQDFESSLKGNPNITHERVQVYNNILDHVSQIEGCDLFVLPELSIPHQLIYNICRSCVSSQLALTAGIEHIRIKNIGYNLILTFLPIRVNGEELDGVPVFRLKNHYSPAEEQLLLGHKLVVPKPNPYRYDLFIWRGFYFTNSYCYELADVFHRVALYGKIDFLIAPIWNPDMPYYNSVVDSTVRDMHCHIIQVNTSQYGSSRVARPTDSLRRDKAYISGGTTLQYKFNILVSDLEIKQLRSFQQLEFHAQKELNKNKKSYKPTPPDYPVESVRKRIEGKFF